MTFGDFKQATRTTSFVTLAFLFFVGSVIWFGMMWVSKQTQLKYLVELLNDKAFGQYGTNWDELSSEQKKQLFPDGDTTLKSYDLVKDSRVLDILEIGDKEKGWVTQTNAYYFVAAAFFGFSGLLFLQGYVRKCVL